MNAFLRYRWIEPYQAIVTTIPILLNTGADSLPTFILHTRQAPFSKAFLGGVFKFLKVAYIWSYDLSRETLMATCL